VAAQIHHAWLSTLEDGVFTADLQGGEAGAVKTGLPLPFGSMDFADAIIERLGRLPQQFKPVRYQQAVALPPGTAAKPLYVRAPAARKAVVGVDGFVHQSALSADGLAMQLQASNTAALALQMITNRGEKVWPGGFPETFCTDHWRCRFVAASDGGEVAQRDIVALLGALTDAGVDVIKTENLCTFDGVKGFALGQGQ
jgi:isocitrate dehydrogenase